MTMNKYGTPDICPNCGAPLHHQSVKVAGGQTVVKAACSTCKNYENQVMQPPQSNDRSPAEHKSD